MERKKLTYLVLAAQDGDDEAASELFNAFYNDVYFFALKTVKDEQNACDITQDTFVTVLTSLHELKEPAAFVTWLKRIAYSQCTRYFRKKKELLVDEDENGETVFDTLREDRTEFIPDKAVDQEDFRRTILGMMDALSEEQRAALLLYYFDELSVKQIALIQGVSAGTVKSRLNYARKSIKAAVEDYEKKNNVKIHSVGILPLLLWLLYTGEGVVMPAAVAGTVAEGVSAATGMTITVGTVTAAAGTAAASAVVAAGTGFGAKIAMLPVATKLTAGIAGVLVVAAGVVAAVVPNKPTQKPAAPPPAIVQTAPSTLDTIPVTTQPRPTEPSVTEPVATEPPVTEPSATQPPATEPVQTQPPATEPDAIQPTVTEPEETQLPVTEPIVTAEVVPQGCTYVLTDGTVLQAGEPMPTVITDGDELITGDYIYKYGYFYGASSFMDQDFAGWGVYCTARQAECEPLLSQINGAPVVSLHNAFQDNTLLTIAPEIPETVTDIKQAFYGCTALTQAPQIPAGITSVYGTFNGCSALKTAPVIPDGVTDLSYAFYNCSSLLASPNIPEGVTALYHTFDGCKAMTTVSDIPDSVTDLTGTFFQCDSLVTAPKIGKNVKKMEWTFYRCDNLTSIPNLPSAVTSLKYAFAECPALVSVPSLPSKVTNLYAAFDNCRALKTAPALNEGIVDMTCAFRNCVALTEVGALPSTVRDLSFAFAGCSALVTAPRIPASVIDMDSAFLDCTALSGTVQIDAEPEVYVECGGSGCYPCSTEGAQCEACSNCSGYADCFTGTVNPIVLTGSSTRLQQIADASDNEKVRVE